VKEKRRRRKKNQIFHQSGNEIFTGARHEPWEGRCDAAALR
jgi:hypothetical protein